MANKLPIDFLFSLQYISLATKIFQFMNKHLIGSRSTYVREYVVNGLVEQQMVILAAIIRDLDHETARTETGIVFCYIVTAFIFYIAFYIFYILH